MKSEQIAVIGGLSLVGLYLYKKSNGAKDQDGGGFSFGSMAGGEAYGGSSSGLAGATIVSDSFNQTTYSTNNGSAPSYVYTSFSKVESVGLPAGKTDTPTTKKEGSSSVTNIPLTPELSSTLNSPQPNWNNPTAPMYLSGTRTDMAPSFSVSSVGSSGGSGSTKKETAVSLPSNVGSQLQAGATAFSNSSTYAMAKPTTNYTAPAPKSNPVTSFFSAVKSFFSGGSKKK